MSDQINPIVNPWHPMSNSVDVKHLGKLLEELGELTNELGQLTAAVSRCLVQGIDESEPITGKCNRIWLEEEIADVDACICLVVERFNLDRSHIANRCLKKMKRLREWHSMA